MSDENSPVRDAIDYGSVMRALRAELATRGHHLASDTTGMNRALYITGPDDTARAVFEFKPNADDAAYELMFQGAWVTGMPPRFVVLPGAESLNPSLETLVQMKAYPLLFDAQGENVAFRDLDQLLEKHIGAG